MIGYRNIAYNPREELIRLFTWDTNGKRIAVDTTFKPYVYLETNNHSDATSIFKTPLKKKTFKNQYEKSKYLKESGTTRVFENFSPAQQFLVDSFWEYNESAEFSQHPLKIQFLDIETYSVGEFPNVETANHMINVVTIYDTLHKKFYTWGLKPYKSTTPDQVFFYCKTENQSHLSVVIF